MLIGSSEELLMNLPLWLSRREALRLLGAGGALAALGPAACSGPAPSSEADFGPHELLAKQQDPYNAEPRADTLVGSWVTPRRYFYVRSHGAVPRIDPAEYRLRVEGMVAEPQELSYSQLESAYPRSTAPATLQCAGNRRSEHHRSKPVGGVLWDQAAIGNAEWTGPRLGDLLRKARVAPGARYVWFEALDEPVVKGEKMHFGASIPLEKALSPETLVALEMNGRPLTAEHGFPARMMVPGYVGARSVKWVHRIVVSDRPTDNYFSARDYKMFPPDVSAEKAKWEEQEPILESAVNSAICSPRDGEQVPAGRLPVRGYAQAPGRRTIARVEVSSDQGGSWVGARLLGSLAPFAWRLWEAELSLRPGPGVLWVRATDSEGGTQPQTAPWNFKGYLYNGWHRVSVQVV
jgi:sulfite oxidase